MKRHKLNRGASNRKFRKGTKVHRRNLGSPMRGGIRL